MASEVEQKLRLLVRMAEMLAGQFGRDCEVVVHDLVSGDPAHSIVFIENGHVSGRRIGDGPSRAVLDTLANDPDSLQDYAGRLTRAQDGRILKSSTMYLRDGDRKICCALCVNYDITGMLSADKAVGALIGPELRPGHGKPPPSAGSVGELLDSLIEQSAAVSGKPVPLMKRADKIAAVRFLRDAGAFLVTGAGDRIAEHFGISKFTLYSYLDNHDKESGRDGT